MIMFPLFVPIQNEFLTFCTTRIYSSSSQILNIYMMDPDSIHTTLQELLENMYIFPSRLLDIIVMQCPCSFYSLLWSKRTMLSLF